VQRAPVAAQRSPQLDGDGVAELRPDHLRQLESEAIYVMRETAGQFQKTVLLFSGGKDSAVMVRLAEKAFRPARAPFTLLHIDTGHNFPEVLQFRDRVACSVGAELLVRYVQDSIDRGRCHEEPGPNTSRNVLQSVTLVDAINELSIDALLGGARRDEEKARAKERFFSHRRADGQWDPKAQRPEPWMLLNGLKRPGEHFRIFPLSNWTELDVWQYVAEEKIPLPSLYFTHRREVVARAGMLLSRSPQITLLTGEHFEERQVRFRTVGDATCTGALESSAATVDDVIREIALARISERGGRKDDQTSDAAMEDRKREGYF